MSRYRYAMPVVWKGVSVYHLIADVAVSDTTLCQRTIGELARYESNQLPRCKPCQREYERD